MLFFELRLQLCPRCQLFSLLAEQKLSPYSPTAKTATRYPQSLQPLDSTQLRQLYILMSIARSHRGPECTLGLPTQSRCFIAIIIVTVRAIRFRYSELYLSPLSRLVAKLRFSTELGHTDP